jgi:hypothetical protein
MLLRIPIPSPQRGVIVGHMPSQTSTFNSSITDAALVDVFLAFSITPIDTSTGIHYDMSQFQFLELILYGCVKSFSTKVVEGRPVTTEVSSSSNIMPGSTSHTMNFFWSPDYARCFVDDKTGCNKTLLGSTIAFAPPPLLASSPSEKYTVDVFTGLTLSYTLYLDIVGGLLENLHLTTSAEEGDFAFAAAAALFGDREGLEPFDPETQYQNIEQLANNIAISLTNGLREGGPTAGDGKDAAVVVGTAYTPQIFVVVRWGWLSMLIVQVTLSSVLLLATAVVTRRRGLQVLKASSLADMFALRRDAPQLLGGIYDYGALEKVSRCQDVRLERSASGTGFWLTPHDVEEGSRESRVLEV